jgi:hypothetical protein
MLRTCAVVYWPIGTVRARVEAYWESDSDELVVLLGIGFPKHTCQVGLGRIWPTWNAVKPHLTGVGTHEVLRGAGLCVM